MKTLQRIAQSCLEFHVSELYIALVGRGKNYANLHAVVKICQIFIISKLLKAFNSHRFNQSDLYTRSWYHGTAASMECLQAPPYTPSSPDRSRLVPLNLDYTRLARSKTNREPVRRLKLTGWLFAVFFQIVTMYYKHGSTRTVGRLLQKPEFSHLNNIQTRFQLLVDFVKIMHYMHNSSIGVRVMCDSGTLGKLLSQYLITGDFHLVVNDLDKATDARQVDGILCNHKFAKEANSWFAPEQRGLSESDTDEKIEIWRIPVIARKLLSGVEDSSFVKSKLENVMTRCQAMNPQQRPTANEVVQELLRVQQLITI